MSSKSAEVSENLIDHINTDQGRVFLELWSDWRGSNLAPRRSDFHVEDLETVLPNVIEFEFVSDTQCIYRFVGSDLVEISGVEQTGTNFFESGHPEDRPLRIARCLELAKYPCGSLARIPSTLNTQTVMIREALMLPVLPDKPTGNIKLVIVSIPLENYRWQTPVLEGSILPIATDFHFIDIGAGVPENSEALKTNIALTL